MAVAIGLIGGHSFPDYDATYALIWGRDILHGHAPDYQVPLRPAGHPLTTLVGLVGAPLGREGAAELLRWVALLGAGAFVASIFRLGQVLFGTLAGVVAAVLLATREPVWGFSLLGFMDAWAAAFVVWAVVIEVRAPRRGAPVFVLLALAGLIRPETWLFALAYWVWILIGSRGRALRMIPLALLGPLLWIAWDLVTSQTFLGSVNTREGAPSAPSSAGHGLANAPRALVRFAGGFMRPPEVVAAAIGVVAIALTAWRRGALAAAVIALNVLAFVLVATRSGPLEQRYLLVACAVALVFSAYAMAAEAPHPRWLRIAGIAAAVACIAYAPIDARRIGDLRDQVHAANAADTALRDLITARAARCALRGRIHLDDVRLRPFVAYWGAVPVQRAGTAPGAPSALVPLDSVAGELTSRSLPDKTERTPLPRPDVPVIASNRSWLLAGTCASQ